MSRRTWLDVPSEVIDRALSGHMVVSPSGETRAVPGFVEFHRGAATFPWRSQARWIAAQMAARSGLDRTEAMDLGAAVFRSDLYRTALASTGAEMPGASDKLEGAVRHPMAVASATGRLILERDAFFDGRIFDPSQH